MVTPLGITPKQITIRAEKTKGLTTISLADDKSGVMMEVNYKVINDLIKRL